jgi:predicted ATPase
MTDGSEFEFRAVELDRNLLATSFEVQTNWHVLAGGPSCGKTTLLGLLERSGFQTVPECARKHMEGELAAGRTIEEVRHDPVVLQRRIFDLQRETEQKLEVGDALFLDGALPGSLAWYRVFGMDPNDILPSCFRYRYASVSIPLPFHTDGIRCDEDAHANFIDAWTYRDFSALGYDVRRVPVMAPEDRLAFVLKSLE